MPPRKKVTKAKSDVSPALPPLSGLRIVLCGTFPNISHTILKQYIERLGAESPNKVTADASHLVATLNSYNAPSAKTRAALGLGVPIVGVQWLLDCASNNAREPEVTYLFSSVQRTAKTSMASSAPPAQSATTRPMPTRKRSAPPSPDNSSPYKSNNVSTSATQPTQKKSKISKPTHKEARISEIVVQVDELYPDPDATVYVDADGTIWDASLNQANTMQNNNKFYIIQIVKNKTKYCTWTRWGRVGEKGQSSILGNGSLNDAVNKFSQKFKNKSGIRWEDRDHDPVPGKYAYVERSYQPDSDEDERLELDTYAREKEKYEPPTCTLLPSIQSLVELIFNQQYFAATMSDLNYDAKKLPLGKLSRSTITRGFQALKNLSALLDDPDLAQSLYNATQPAAIENLSNLYYSVIPHVFGRNRPPIIGDHIRLKREIDLLESLSDMKDAELLMKVGPEKLIQKAHPADLQYQGLGMKETTPLEHSSNEFRELASYLSLTRGTTHNVKYTVEDIFRIERQNEQSRFDDSIVPGPTKDKRLLWHGSRVTNFAGILSQGLRIAPPEAPVSGYMFGKGIYLADMSSKSANYCCAHMSNRTALLLLCEADLGVPLYELVNSSYTAGEDARKNGMFSTLGKGMTAPLAWKDAGCVHKDLTGVKMPDVSVPPGTTSVGQACLQYNEYIVYDVSQIRLRYLFRVRM